MVDRITRCWSSDRPFFLDGFLIEDEEVIGESEEAIAVMLRLLSDKGLQPTPVTGLDRNLEYAEAVKQHLSQHGDAGCCLRLTSYDFEAPSSLEGQIDSLIDMLNIKKSRVDLLIDYGPLPPAILGGLKTILPTQINTLPALSAWRTVIFAGSGFPKDLREVKKNSITEIERTEWLAWRHLVRTGCDRMPIFGDYAITHPEFEELDPRLIRMSPKIKYTDDVRWVVAKGEALRRKREPGSSIPLDEQYRSLARAIMQHEAWKGPGFSWGDQCISECSEGLGPSSAQKWVSAGCAHHFAFVSHQLANLPST